MQATHPFERSCKRDALRVVDARDRRPVAVFVQAAQFPLEVDAPHLRIGVPEFEGAKRNPDLGGPAGFGDPRLHVPDAVPVGVVIPSLVGHLRIPLCARGIGGELVRVAAVVKGIQDDAEAVTAAGVVVLLQVTDDDFRRLHVVREHTEVERVVCVEDSNVGVVGRVGAFAGIILDETVRDRRFPPRRLVERAVERNRATRAHRREPLFEVDGLVVDDSGRPWRLRGCAGSGVGAARGRNGRRPGCDILGEGRACREHNYGESALRDESLHEKRKLYLLSACSKRRFRSSEAMKLRKEVQKIIEIPAVR